MTKQISALEYFKGDELAASVWQNKYAAQGEVNPDDTHLRMAKEFARIEVKYGKLLLDNETKNKLSKYGKARLAQKQSLEAITERIYSYFKDFKYIIPQGSVMSVLGTNVVGSLSNCFVIDSPDDSYSGIMEKDEEMAQLMKRRGGVGLDISTLRPAGVTVKNSAKTSTGAASFMERYSNTCREVAQQGRRGALMITMDVRHPDIFEFVTMKQDLSKVTGANVSVQLRDDFMKAVETDSDYLLRFPCDVEVEMSLPEYNCLYSDNDNTFHVKKIKAKELYDKIVECAWNTAEPGQMFKDRGINYSPDGVYPQYRFKASNPCFRGDMKLLTVDGEKTFEELENTTPYIYNEYGEVVQCQVWCSGEKDVVRVLTWNNKSIYCTKNHKFKTVDDEELEAHQLVDKRLKVPYVINSEITEYTKLGFIQGDGNLTRLNSDRHLGIEINLGEKDQDVADIFNVQWSVEKRSYYIQGFNVLLHSLGFQSKVLPLRSLPITFGIWDTEDKLMFLKGLFSANGSIISKQRIALKSTCKELVEQVSSFLKVIGINCYITTNKAKEVEFSNGNYICKESYDLNIADFDSILIFAKRISFIHKYKRDALEETIKNKSPKVRSVSHFSGYTKVYDYTILEGTTHYGIVEGVVASNCGEQLLDPHNSCRLICENLYSFVTNPFTSQAELDFEKLYEISYEQMVLGDNLVDLEIEYVQRIIDKILSEPRVSDVELNLWLKVKDKAIKSRRVGCGITGLADMLAAMGYQYDSFEGIAIAEVVMKTKMEAELDATIDMAILRSSFADHDPSLEFDIAGDSMNGYVITGGKNDFYEMLFQEFPIQVYRMCSYRRRNVSWSTIAPTGSVSICTQTTSGCEPLFMPYYQRNKKVQGDEVADFVDAKGDKWKKFFVVHPKLIDFSKAKFNVDCSQFKEEAYLIDLFKQSPYNNSTAESIDWQQRVKMQAVLQQYTTNAISSTINLPADVTKKEVAKIYVESWKQGLKGVTVYRDGCRTGVLVKVEKEQPKERPYGVEAELYSIGGKFTVIVGLINNNPYEVFVFETSTLESLVDVEKYPIPNKGSVIKKDKSYYYSWVIKEFLINEAGTAEERAVARLISAGLRGGVDVKFLVEQLMKTEGSLQSINFALAKVLGNYIPDGSTSSLSCTECGSSEVVFQEGCLSCKSCGSSKCG